MARLVRAVDAAIAEENRKFLADPHAIAAAKSEGEIYRRRLESEGILPVGRAKDGTWLYRRAK